MNTDDRALADRVRSAVEELANTHMSLTLEHWCQLSNTILAAADRLEAFHAKPDRDDIERDVRIAIWNAGMKGGMGQDLSQAFIVRAMAEPTMVRALDAAALQSPPPVVHPLAQMVALDEEIEAEHPGWMTGQEPA